VCPPTIAIAVVGRPIACAARETFVPFPPGTHEYFCDRMNVPTANVSMNTVLSTHGFGVRVRIIETNLPVHWKSVSEQLTPKAVAALRVTPASIQTNSGYQPQARKRLGVRFDFRATP
jgi:hypothetical protein